VPMPGCCSRQEYDGLESLPRWSAHNTALTPPILLHMHRNCTYKWCRCRAALGPGCSGLVDSDPYQAVLAFRR
jgi:hypothetical protein